MHALLRAGCNNWIGIADVLLPVQASSAGAQAGNYKRPGILQALHEASKRTTSAVLQTQAQCLPLTVVPLIITCRSSSSAWWHWRCPG